MANEILVKSSVVSVKKEGTFGVDPTADATNVIRVADIEVDDEYEKESWDEIANTKDSKADLWGNEKTPGSIKLNMRASGTAGTAPEGDPLYECAFGEKHAYTGSTVAASSDTDTINVDAGDGSNFAVNDIIACIVPTATTFTTGSGSTTTSIVLTATTGLAVGDIVQVPNSDGTALIEATEVTVVASGSITVSPALTAAPDASMTVKKAGIEFTRVTAITTDALTVAPALSAAPDTYSQIRSGVTYKCTLSDLPSFFLDFWRGNVVHETYGGNKESEFSLDIQSGKIIQPSFTFEGIIGTKTLAAYGLGTPTFNSEIPIVAVSQNIKLGGSTVRCDKFAIKVANEIYDDQDISTSGIVAKIHTGRTVSGSFSSLYRSLDFFTAFKNHTSVAGVIALGEGGSLMKGKAVAIILPKMRYEETPLKATDKLYQYDVTYKAENSEVGQEDSICMAFL